MPEKEPCMIIGVPKEIKNLEYRVGLTPSSVRELIDHGHTVLVQKNAAAEIGFDDRCYLEAGARIVASAQKVFAEAEMIVKVKEPQPRECAMLREGQILFTYLHLAPDPLQTQGLIKSGCTAIAYETVTDEFGGLPLLAPMSEVAGRMSIQAGAHALEMAQGGRGTLLGGVPGVAPAKVTIIGGGVVGSNAARMAIGLGAETLILDRSVHRLQYLDDLFQGRVRVEYSTATAIETHVLGSDLVIGAVLIPGAAAPKLVTREMVRRMPRGSVLVDVAIDQGGCFETSRATTHEHPTYKVDEVVHYCVANMPGAVARTSTLALNNSTLPYSIALADYGIEALLRQPHLRHGLNVHQGKVTYQAVSKAQNLDYVPAEDALRRSAT
jgi:alanine dehydrogenase